MDEARRAGLDGERFRIDLESNATLEAFGGDLEESRDDPGGRADAGLAAEGSHGSSVERLRFPALRLVARTAARRLGGRATTPTRTGVRRPWQLGAARAMSRGPTWPAALRRFGRMATAELEAVCDLPGPRAGAEVWRLASEWRVKRVPVLAGELWEPA